MDVKSLTIAIPVLNGGDRFIETLEAIKRQRNAAAVELELLVVDSGSTDGSVERAREAGARVIEIDKRTFQHGGTRNMAIAEAKGEVVAMLTDDSTPATDGWLDAIVEGFAQADDVALVFGPQIARPEHSHVIRREMKDHFDSFSSRPIQREGDETFFSDANGAVAKWAWQDTPYKEVAYAEDQQLGQDMLAAGHAKVYSPAMAVNHSHDYTAWQWLKRYFDEFRGLRETIGYRAGNGPRAMARAVVGLTRTDRGFLRHEGVGGMQLQRLTLKSLRHHTTRQLGEWLGGRADAMPVWLARRLSLEGRGEFHPAPSTQL